ncbi:HIT domain-containing protein [Patescibacteria group bacterium]|nr:HIT domain-containing protein [Patescibacteria group bacterium]
MTDCLFCKIIAREIPSYQVYEDDLFFGFLDIKPLNPGHSLLLPKKHYQWVYDVPEVKEYWAVANKIALASIKAVKADFVSFLTIGVEIPHAHIHIIPRFFGDDHGHGIDTTKVKEINSETMTQIAKSLNLHLQ